MSNYALAETGATVVVATSHDARFPANNIIDGNEDTFWLTGGMYPQEVVIAFAKNIHIARVGVVSRGAHTITLQRCDKNVPVQFDDIGQIECDKTSGVQQEIVDVNNQSARFLKLIINRGYEEFTAIYHINVEGREG